MKKNFLLLFLMALLPLAGRAGNIGIQLSTTLTKEYGTADPVTLAATDFVIISNDTGNDGITTADLAGYLVFKRKQGQTGEDCGTYDYEVSVSDEWGDSEYAEHTIVATNTGRITITPKPLADVTIADIEDVIYDGNEWKPEPVVSYPDPADEESVVVLEKGTHFTYSYDNNVNAGQATVTITAEANTNYTGTKSVHFTIEPRPITALTIGAIAAQTYAHGVALTPALTVTGTGVDRNNASKNYTLAAADYKATYEDNVNAGTATVTVSAPEEDGNFDLGELEEEATFTINPKNLGDEDIAFAAINNQPYTGAALTPEATVNWTIGEEATAITDFLSLGYTNNTLVGKATVTATPNAEVEGSTNYTGSVSTTFSIVPPGINTANIEIDDEADLIYDGTEKTPDFTVTIGETVLTKGTDYVIVSWANNKNAAEANAEAAPSVTIKGIGNYDAVDENGDPLTNTKYFTIEKRVLTITANDVTTTYGVSPEAKFGYTTNIVEGEDLGIANVTYTVYEGEEVVEDDLTALDVSEGQYTYKANVVTFLQPEPDEPEEDVTYATEAQIAARANYDIVNIDKVEGDITVTVATLIIVPDNLSKKYGSNDPATFTYKVYNGEVAEDNLVDASEEGFWDEEPTLERAEGDDAGTYTISVTNATATEEDAAVAKDGYTINCQTGTFTINPFKITVTANDQTIIYGGAPNLETTITSMVQTVVNGEQVNGEVITVTFSPSMTGNQELIDRDDLNLTLTWDEENNALIPAIDNANFEPTLENGTVTIEAAAAIELVRVAKEDFNDAEKNTAAAYVEQYNGEEGVNVTIKFNDATAYNTIKEGQWYAMVLPFETDAKIISDAFGYAIIDLLRTSNTNPDATYFDLHLNTEKIPANTPFLIKVWKDIDMNATGVTFNGVDIEAPQSTEEFTTAKSVDAAGCQFIGSYTGKIGFGGAGSKDYWYSLVDGSLKQPSATAYLRQMSAYIKLAPDAVAESHQFIIEEIDGSTTSIRSIELLGTDAVSADGWFNLSGVKMQGAPTEKGVYIKDGKKVVVK